MRFPRYSMNSASLRWSVGLASYGTSLADAYRQLGIYTGRVLNGDKPADLPVMQSTKFEFVINLKTANALGLEISPTLLGPRRRGDRMIRREFITLLGGAAAAWPLAVQAQQPERVRRIGVLMNTTASDAEGKARFAAFSQALQRSGWADGRNVRVDVRWIGGADIERFRRQAAELVALAADVIVTTTTPSTLGAQQTTRTVPIVFAMAVDPMGGGFVESLARPGGNITGFMQFEYTLSGKWLELLKQIAPGVTRAAVFRDPTNPSGIGQFAVIQAMAPPLGIEVIPINVRDAAEIERLIAAFARGPNGGLVATGGQATTHRELIFKLALQHRLPAVYPYRYYVAEGGLVSYGPDLLGLFRQTAGYVDRILKGENPADLPVQTPIRYQLVINLKTAKAIGLDIPATVLARADEVIE